MDLLPRIDILSEWTFLCQEWTFFCQRYIFLYHELTLFFLDLKNESAFVRYGISGNSGLSSIKNKTSVKSRTKLCQESTFFCQECIVLYQVWTFCQEKNGLSVTNRPSSDKSGLHSVRNGRTEILL